MFRINMRKYGLPIAKATCKYTIEGAKAAWRLAKRHETKVVGAGLVVATKEGIEISKRKTIRQQEISNNNQADKEKDILICKGEQETSVLDRQIELEKLKQQRPIAAQKEKGEEYYSPLDDTDLFFFNVFDAFSFAFFFSTPILILISSFFLYFLSLSSLFLNLHEFLLTKFLPSSTILKISSS